MSDRELLVRIAEDTASNKAILTRVENKLENHGERLTVVEDNQKGCKSKQKFILKAGAGLLAAGAIFKEVVMRYWSHLFAIVIL